MSGRLHDLHIPELAYWSDIGIAFSEKVMPARYSTTGNEMMKSVGNMEVPLFNEHTYY
jgi:hypothetical protein